MKTKYFILVGIVTMVFISGCTSFGGGSVGKRYNKLSTRLDKLMEDEIDESSRAELENEFKNLKQEMWKYKLDNPGENTKYMNEYFMKIDKKIEYLQDLKD